MLVSTIVSRAFGVTRQMVVRAVTSKCAPRHHRQISVGTSASTIAQSLQVSKNGGFHGAASMVSAQLGMECRAMSTGTPRDGKIKKRATGTQMTAGKGIQVASTGVSQDVKVQELENAVKSTVTEINDTNAALKKARDSKDIDFLRDNLLKLRDALKQLRDELTRASAPAPAPACIEEKLVHLILPSSSKSSKTVTKTVMFQSSEAFDAYCYREQLGFKDSTTGVVVTDFKALVSGRIYIADGERVEAKHNQRTALQVEAAVLEIETALAVQRSLGANTVLHLNLKIEVNEINHEFDAVVVKFCDVTKTTTAFIVESARSPEPSEIEVLLAKVVTFSAYAATADPFKTVTKFVPVLGGRRFLKETISKCIAHNVSRVSPSGAGYDWVCDEHQRECS